MKVRRLAAFVTKETLQMVRDPSAFLIAFVLPVILLFIFGYGVNLDSNRVRMGLLVEQQSLESTSLAQAFVHSKFLDVTIAHDRGFLQGELTAGRLRGFAVIPETFSAEALLANEAPVQVIADGSEPNIASFVHNYSRALVQQWLQSWLRDRGEEPEQRAIAIEPRFWYNDELKSRNFLVPSSVAIVMTLIGTLLTALVIAREWERGTMEAVMATPITIAEILLGKLIPYFVLGMVSMVLCVLVAVLFYEVPFRGSVGALMLLSSLFLLAALGQGLLISTVARDQFVASQIALLSAFLPAFILSGFIFEISSMPDPVQLVSHVVVARYFVPGLQTLFLTGTVWGLLLREIVAILIISAVFFLIIMRRSRKRLD